MGLLCAGQGAQAKPHAVIRWASHGVPHIKASNWTNLGFGYGYALASMDICRSSATRTCGCSASADRTRRWPTGALSI
jgi:acyl-homoserine lactone acylase PvdQ